MWDLAVDMVLDLVHDMAAVEHYSHSVEYNWNLEMTMEMDTGVVVATAG